MQEIVYYSHQAIPHFKSKRQAINKIRPQSVVGLGIDNLSLSHIPDLLESPNISNRGSKGVSVDDENCDSITELPSASLTLQHLVKSRPKRAKVRAPTRPLLTELSHSLGEGLETFFTKPESETTLTPLVSPTSEECSSLSFVDSPTMSREENIGGKKSTMTSGETTPIMEERRAKLERQSPLLKGVANWTPRSLSSDNLEKCSPLVGRKSPLVKTKTEVREHVKYEETTNLHNILNPLTGRDSGKKSPSNESIKSIYEKQHHGNGIKTPTMLQKPRPWSVLGHESKNEYNNDSTKTTPDALDNGETSVRRMLECFSNFVIFFRS